MNETQRYVLRRCHVELVRDLEPKFILDVLYQDGILTDNDLELIQAETSARGRCQILLSMLPTRGPSAYGSFQRALRETNYMHLEEILDKIEDTEANNNVNKTSPNNCTRAKELQNENKFPNKKRSENTSIICGQCKQFLESKIVPKSEESVFVKVVTKHCCILMHNIEPKELIDEFYQNVLLSDDQCERIRVGTTRKDRCEIFFEELVRGNSDDVLSVLMKSLRKKYLYIVNDIKTMLKAKQTPNKNVRSTNTEQLQVLTKLREIEKDTEVKRNADEIPQLGECILEDQNIQTLRKLTQGTGDLDTMKTHRKEILHNCDECSDISTSDEYEAHTFQKLKEINHVNDLTATRPKEYLDFDDFEMSVLKSCNEYEDIHTIQESTSQNNNTFHKSSEQTPYISDTASATKQVTENGEESFEEFSWSITQERTPGSDNSSTGVENISNTPDYLDEPDGMLILRPPSYNAIKVHTRSDASKELSDKTTKDINECDPQFETKRKSRNRNKAKNNTNTLEKLQTSKVLQNETDVVITGSNAVEEGTTNAMTNTLQLTTFGSASPNEPSKRLSFAFNHLSTLINEGNYERFEFLSQRLQDRFPTDYDMLCIVGYLKTSRDLFLTDFDSAKQKINSTMELVPKTSNPRYFTLELFTTKSRMYITQKKLEKLQSTLDDAMMILETDPVGCSGRAAGWLYINDARNQTAKVSVLNLSKPNALKIYEQLYERAKSSFKRSMTNFKNDGGKDGPFGFGYALCRLVILLLRCGDNGMTMNTLNPLPEDIDAAEQYIKNLEDSEIALAKILEMHFRLAKCDYYFRRENTVRALEHAETAYNLACELKLLEFTEHAHNRLKFLRSRTQLKVKELNDDEVNTILFGETSETLSSQSD